MISIELLRMSPYFGGLSYYLLTEIAMLSKLVEIAEGEWLFYEGDEAENLFVILEGTICLTINIFLNKKARDIEVCTPAKAKDLLGWFAVVRPYKYVFGGKAIEKSKLIAVESEPLRMLLDDNPEEGCEIFKNISELIGERLIQSHIQCLSLALESKDFPEEKLYSR